MSLLVISGLVIRMGGRSLLDGADLTVEPGRRIGLVGRNGAGKSTLLRAIAGEIATDGGDIRLARSARLATVKQEAPAGEEMRAASLNYTDSDITGDKKERRQTKRVNGGTQVIEEGRGRVEFHLGRSVNPE